MPSYMSHIIMGIDVLNELDRNDLLIREVNDKTFRTFTLGADLASLSLKVKFDPHNKNTKLFFLDLIHYIKQNNYDKNDNAMGLLYGHIVHYFMDINVHPFIYYLESGSNDVGLITNHFLIEGYIDSYIVNKKLDIDVLKVDCICFDKVNWNDPAIKNTLNSVYGRIYGDYGIVEAYKSTLFWINLWEKFHKKIVCSRDFKVNITGFRKFIKKSGYTKPSSVKLFLIISSLYLILDKIYEILVKHLFKFSFKTYDSILA